MDLLLVFFAAPEVLDRGATITLLFLFVIEGLSRMINEAKLKGILSGIKISCVMQIINLLFVDDVILFGLVIIEEWRNLHEILTILCFASGVDISLEKFILYQHRVFDEMLAQIGSLLQYKVENFYYSFKYLGYLLNPNNYRIESMQIFGDSKVFIEWEKW